MRRSSRRDNNFFRKSQEVPRKSSVYGGLFYILHFLLVPFTIRAVLSGWEPFCQNDGFLLSLDRSLNWNLLFLFILAFNKNQYETNCSRYDTYQRERDVANTN